MKNVVLTAKNTSLFHRMQVRNSFDYARLSSFLSLERQILHCFSSVRFPQVEQAPNFSEALVNKSTRLAVF